MHLDTKILQQFGSRFPPKITYFFCKNRITRSIRRYEIELDKNGECFRFQQQKLFVAIPEELRRVENNEIYVPWLNQDVIKNPQVLWKFLWTAIRYPSWIYGFTKLDHYSTGLTREYRYDANIIRRMVKYISVCVSLS